MFLYAILVILLLLGFIGAFRIQAYLTDRAAAQVVARFRERQAEDIWSAKGPEELGLAPRGFMLRLADPRRDYKPIALRILINIGVIRKTGQSKLYLSERDLAGVCRRTENRLRICAFNRSEARGS